MSPKSFSVRIFCQDGHADGVKILAKSKWPGRGLVIPRSSLPEEINRVELNAPGVYILVGSSAEGDLPTIYVGAGDPVCRDLEQHDAQKDFWSRAFVFASKDGNLKQSHFHYLEARLLQLAQAARRTYCNSLANRQIPELTATELPDVEAFLDHILSLCPLFGLYAFEKNVM